MLDIKISVNVWYSVKVTGVAGAKTICVVVSTAKSVVVSVMVSVMVLNTVCVELGSLVVAARYCNEDVRERRELHRLLKKLKMGFCCPAAWCPAKTTSKVAKRMV